MTASWEEQMVTVLAKHRFKERTSISGPAMCRCGWEAQVSLGHSIAEAHARHQLDEIKAAGLAATEREWLNYTAPLVTTKFWPNDSHSMRDCTPWREVQG